MLLQFININGLDKKIAFEVGIYKLTKLDEHNSWQDAVNYLIFVSDIVFRLTEEQSSTLTNHAVSRIAEYIDQHLDEDLSLTRLAEVGGFNASYLSRLFKQTYRINILEFIFQRRIQYAKKLLETSNLMIQEIAVKTGYQSANSFARMFRKATGYSPAEYREFHKTGK
jgi:two-component system response regulator YesN